MIRILSCLLFLIPLIGEAKDFTIREIQGEVFSHRYPSVCFKMPDFGEVHSDVSHHGEFRTHDLTSVSLSRPLSGAEARVVARFPPIYGSFIVPEDIRLAEVLEFSKNYIESVVTGDNTVVSFKRADLDADESHSNFGKLVEVFEVADFTYYDGFKRRYYFLTQNYQFDGIAFWFTLILEDYDTVLDDIAAARAEAWFSPVC